MDLNPVALRPFAQIPQIPQVERIEQLKTYGDADSTESTSALTTAFALNPLCAVYTVPLTRLALVPRAATVPAIL